MKYLIKLFGWGLVLMPLGAIAAEGVIKGSVQLEDPLPGVYLIEEVMLNILTALIGLVGLAVFAIFIYGGISFIAAGGSEEKISKSKKILVWATLGLIGIFSSYAILTFIYETFL